MLLLYPGTQWFAKAKLQKSPVTFAVDFDKKVTKPNGKQTLRLCLLADPDPKRNMNLDSMPSTAMSRLKMVEGGQK